jgi:hypothetical protein
MLTWKHWLRAIACCWVLPLGAIAAGDVEPRPVATAGGTPLKLPEINLSLVAPGPDWEWEVESETRDSERPRHQVVTCQQKGGSGRIIVNAFEPNWQAMNASYALQFLQGVESSLKEKGCNTTSVGPDPVDIPVPGSFRFRVMCTTDAGASNNVWGYIGAADRLFTFQSVTTGAEEPQELPLLVSSYRFIGEAPEPFRGIAPVHGFISFTLTLFLGTVGWVVNRVAGRVVVNLWRVAAVLLVVIGIGLSIFWIPRMPAGLTPHRQGRAFGYAVLGPIFWPAAIALWRSRALERRRSSERAAALRGGTSA